MSSSVMRNFAFETASNTHAWNGPPATPSSDSVRLKLAGIVPAQLHTIRTARALPRKRASVDRARSSCRRAFDRPAWPRFAALARGRLVEPFFVIAGLNQD